MTNIDALQKEWQQNLDQFLADDKTSTKQKDAYAETLSVLENKIKQNHGLSRLKNPFIKATKIAPLRRKQKKLNKHIAAENAQVTAQARDAFVSLGEAAVQGSRRETEYNYLNSLFNEIDNTQRVVLNAADQCSNASSSESFAGMNDKNIGMDMWAQDDTQDAVNAIQDAQSAVKSLLKHVKNVPRVDKDIAAEISSMNGNAFFMDLTGSFFGTFANWDLADKLDDAESHLRRVAGELGQSLSDIAGDKMSILKAAVAETRKTDPAVEQLMGSLETYLSSNRKPEKQKYPKPQ